MKSPHSVAVSVCASMARRTTRGIAVVVFALSAWSCAHELQVAILRAPGLGNVLGGVTVYVPSATDKRGGRLFCYWLNEGGHRYEIADVAGPLTDALKLALEDAGAVVVSDPQAPFSIGLAVTGVTAVGDCHFVDSSYQPDEARAELAVTIRQHERRLWSGPVVGLAKPDSSEDGTAHGVANALSQAVVEVRDIFIEQLKSDSTAPTVAGTVANATGDLKLKVPQRILVLPLKRQGDVPEATAALIGNFLLSQLSGVDGLTTIGVADLDAVLSVDRKRQALGCNDVACLAELGGALGTDLVLHGEIGRLGSVYNINVSVLRSRDGTVVTRASLLGEKEEDAVAKRMPGLVQEIVTRLNR
jgi:hypothetical protein